MKLSSRLTPGITLALLFVLMGGFVRPASAGIVYVNKNAPGTVHNGTSWATAFTSVQHAIDAAASGDEVWVAAGTYLERVTITPAVSLYGGFAGSETARTQRDWKQNPTTVDGKGSPAGNVITSQSPQAALDGFTIRGGDCGVKRTSGVISVANCTLVGNWNGVDGASPVTNCTIRGSRTGVTGSNYVSNCLITGNGTGVVDYRTRIANCTISGNVVGISVSYTLFEPVANCIVAYNQTGIKQSSSNSLALYCNDVYGNTTANYADLTDPTGILGNISLDPGLANRFQNGHIRPGSPCIDAGMDTFAGTGATDIDGQPRIIRTHVDIGADESDGTEWTVPARVWYVAPTGDDDNDGTAWAKAKKTVSGGLAVAQGSDEVWVAKGVYVENVAVPAGVALYGGFAGAETSRAQRDYSTNASVLEGNPADTAAASVVTAAFLESVIDGFTVRNGTGWDGHGITVIGTAIIANNRITGNHLTSGASGGGIFVHGGTATITSNVITDNGTGEGYGGGICVYGGAATISNNTIGANDASWGGGIHLRSCAATVVNSVVRENRAAFGGGIYVEGSTATIAGNTITANTVSWADGAGICVNSGTLAITNNTIVGNGSTSGGFGAVLLNAGTSTLNNNIVAFNSTSGICQGTNQPIIVLGSNDVYQNGTRNYQFLTDPTGTNGNIRADPLFVNQTGGDFGLQNGSPCIDAGDDSAVAYTTDQHGGRRIMGPNVDMGAIESVPRPWSVLLGVPPSSGVTVADRTAYIPGRNGQLYARRTIGGVDTFGFPVNINLAVGATVKLPARAAVYYGKTGKAIYLTTDRGDVLRILPSGQVAWHTRPLPGQTVSTPAVTPMGEVFVNLSTGTGPFNNFAFKLDEATGMPLTLSPFLGYTSAGDIGDFSPAANNRYLYVNAGWGSRSGVTVLNQDNLVARASFAAGEQCLSPLLLGSDLILASKSGKVYKLNAVTLNPDLEFGHFGVADVGGQISAAPFADAAGNVYLGAADGRILKWAPGTTGFVPFYIANGRIAGLTINRADGVLGFGTSIGAFVQVPLDNPAGAITVSTGSPISTGAVYESLTDRFIVVTDTGVLSGYPSMR